MKGEDLYGIELWFRTLIKKMPAQKQAFFYLNYSHEESE